MWRWAVAFGAGALGYTLIHRSRTSRKYLSKAVYWIGLDVGGTTVNAGITDQNGQLLNRVTELVNDKDPAQICRQLADLARQLVMGAGVHLRDVTGVGVGFPGSVDGERGVIVRVANFPSWDNVPFAQMLSDAIGGIPVVLENDAKAACLAEMWVGAGQDPSIRDMVMVTVGTGIGSAIVINNRLVRGVCGMAGEVGHCILYPHGELSEATGVRGICETYCAAPAVVARAEYLLSSSSTSSLAPRRPFTCHTVFEHAQQGDAVALQAVDFATENLAICLINICRTIDPPLIVLTGGVTQAGNFFLDRVRSHFRKHHWSILEPRCVIQSSALGNSAGTIGAAAAARYAVQGIGES